MNIIKKTVKVCCVVFLLLVISLVIYLNCGLYYAPRFATIEKDEVNIDVLGQLRFLKTQMHKGAADDMQQYYPEGFVFMNALYGLSWCEFIKHIDKNSELFKEAHKEIQFAYNEINSEKGRHIFQEQLPLPYGSFYVGWKNYLLAKKLSVEAPANRDSTEIRSFEANCNNIAAAIDSSASPYPESYKGYAWPADVSVCIACLANHDKLFEQKYAGSIALWISKAKKFTDPDGLLPYAFDPVNMQVKENAKGSSQSLVQVLLFETDSAFCSEQFVIYKKLFLDSRAGLPGIRQYKKGSKGPGDADSGPIIFGIGGPASIVGLRAMSLMKEDETAIGLRNSIETFGFSTESGGRKKYIFGKLPMADAFICWANATETDAATKLHSSKHWRTRFQLYSLLILLPAVFLLWKLTGFRTRNNKRSV